MADNAGLAAALDGIPMVADAAARDARFPVATRKQNQRVFRLDLGIQQRWSGSAWVDDTESIVHVGVSNGSDDSAHIQAAMTAASGKTLRFAPGETYTIATEISGVSNVLLDFNGCTIQGTTTRIRSFFYFSGKSNVTWRGPVTFDLGKSQLVTYADYPTTYQAAGYFDSCADITITDLSSSNLYTQVLFFYNCSGAIRIIRPRMTSPQQTQKLRMEHLMFQTCSADIAIEDIRVDNGVSGAPASADVVPCAIFASGTRGKFVVDGATFNYCGRNNAGAHRLGVIDFYGDSQHVTLRNIVSTNQMAQFTRLSSVADVLVDGLTVEMANGAEAATQIVSVESTVTFVGVGQTGTQRVTLRNLDLTDLYDATRTGVAISSYDYSVPATDIVVDTLSVTGLKNAVLIGGPYQNITIDRVSSTGANGGTVSVMAAPGGVTVTATNGVTEAQSAFNNLRIGRVTNLTSSTTAAPIVVDLTKVPEYTGSVGQIAIDDCVLKSTPANSATAINVRLTSSSSTGRVLMRRNDVEHFATALSAQYVNQFTYEGNRSRTLSASPVSTSTVTTTTARGNRWSTGPSSGRAVLVTGTVTVTTAEVQAGDNILLTRVVTGGTVGHLTVGTITAGTSFVITSSSGTDTSTIFWEIVH